MIYEYMNTVVRDELLFFEQVVVVFFWEGILGIMNRQKCLLLYRGFFWILWDFAGGISGDFLGIFFGDFLEQRMLWNNECAMLCN